MQLFLDISTFPHTHTQHIEAVSFWYIIVTCFCTKTKNKENVGKTISISLRFLKKEKKESLY